jgi:hypothetical protein
MLFAPLHHDDFGLIQSKIMNLIDSNNLELNGTENRYPLFLIPLKSIPLSSGPT